MLSDNSLQIPIISPSHHQSGPSSRQYRPVSVSVQPSPSAVAAAASPSSSRKRASYNVAPQQQQQQQQQQPQLQHQQQQQQHQNQQQSDSDQPAYRDVYSHPAAVAYAAAHPRRTIPKFGPYLLLQTLGEGEFGKVKLGLHSQWGEEVAVKLIRRGNIDTTVRMSKVEREIEVLRTLKHPNIVRLYDVIETDKYIGIILEYASGGELFDHILAHRYLKEKDAAKLFSQLLSGVWYIHQKKIVHRDLKLENLLLDRHRNVIITDFGFANRFEHRSDDLMQTSCGSPCYAAPELVISEGLYVGSAVDIWSCGVILYAMLAGYLPFDDDPANPDGDNINLLYKYIVNTPLSFPEYISPSARDLLGMMLVPDPARRADLGAVMDHEWLRTYRDGGVFGRDVEELERAAMELHQMKRLAYQRQMRAVAAEAAAANGGGGAITNGSSSKGAGGVARTQSARPDVFGGGGPSTSSSASNAPPPPPPNPRSQSYTKPPPPHANSHAHHHPEYLYETSTTAADQASPSPPVIPPSSAGAARRGLTPTHTPAPVDDDDDPFGPSPVDGGSGMIPIHLSVTGVEEVPRARRDSKGKGPAYPSYSHSHGQHAPLPVPVPAPVSPEATKKRGAFRHTIQVEYGESDAPGGSAPQQPQSQGLLDTPRQSPAVPPKTKTTSPGAGARRQDGGRVRTVSHDTPTSTAITRRRADEVESSKPLPAAPSPTRNTTTSPRPQPHKATAAAPIVSIASATPPSTPSADQALHAQQQLQRGTGSTGSRSSKSGHRRGLSVDKLGLGKLFGSSSSSGASPGAGANVSGGELQVQTNGMNSRVPSEGSAVTDEKQLSSADASSSLLSPNQAEQPASAKKNRRNTLTIMVGTIKGKKGGSNSKSAAAAAAAAAEVPPAAVKEKQQPRAPPLSAVPPATPSTFRNASKTNIGMGIGMGIPASTNKANKVMQWFRSKSKGSADAPPPGFLDEPSRDLLSSESSTNNNSGSNSNSNSMYPATPTQATFKAASSSSATVNQQQQDKSWYGDRSTRSQYRPARTASTGTDASFSMPTLADRVRRSVGVVVATPAQPKGVLRIHHGAVDHSTITTRPPPEVMKHVREVLEGMGVEIRLESEFKYRCVRMKRRKAGTGIGLGLRDVGSGNGLAAFTMVGSAASNGVDKRGLPLPSPSSFGATGGMLKGLLMRRQSSQVSSSGMASQPSLSLEDDAAAASPVAAEPSTPTAPETVYGDQAQDAGDEVRFSVELTRLDRLNDTFSLDIRRLKGNLRSYKFLYDTLRERADLQR